MENHPCENFPQENYNGEDTLHSNPRRPESSMALEEEYFIGSCHIHYPYHPMLLPLLLDGKHGS